MNPRMPDDAPEPRRLLFASFLPLCAGALVGVLLRFVFSEDPGDPFSAMSGTFIFCAPMIVGAVTVYLAERIERRSLPACARLGAVANVLFVLGTMAVLIEGVICAVLIVPLFALIGAVGGVLMGLVCRFTGWPRRSVHAFALLPAVLLITDVSTPLPVRIRQVEASILIDSSPARVWQEIQNVRDIRTDEIDQAWAFRIGVPTPQSGTSTTLDVPLRRITMGKNVYFDQIVAVQRQNQFVRWHYRFYEDSFPPHALDDHVRVGGHYFDLIDTSYSLEPAGNRTRLTLQAHYRVSTRFNWYAGPVVHWLLDNAAGAYLELYKHRAEAIQG